MTETNVEKSAAPAEGEQVFNADLLVQKADQIAVRRDFPLIADSVIWQDMIKKFLEFELRAADAKSNARNFGLSAIRFALIALLLLSFGALIRTVLTALFRSIGVGTITADNVSALLFHLTWGACFVSGLWFANHALFGKRRIAWLLARMQAERTRQFNFQYLLANFELITSDHPVDRNRVLNRRAEALERALEEFEPARGSGIASLADDIEHRKSFLVEAPVEGPIGNPDLARVKELLRYLRLKRLEYQAGHASRMMDPECQSTTQSVKAQFLQHVITLRRNSICFVVFQLIALILFLADVFIALASGWSGVLTLGGWTIPFSALPLLSQMIALGFAALVVAERVREDGLHLRGDLARYRTYAGLMHRVKNEIQVIEHELVGEDAYEFEKIRSRLIVAEELAYWELCNFLEMHRGSSFSL